MAGATAEMTDDVGGEVLVFGAVILAMTETTAVLADLVLVVTEGTVECSELAKLIAFVVVFTFGSRRSLEIQDCEYVK